MDENGHMTCSKNGELPKPYMEVDIEKCPLWLVLDVYGSTASIRLMGKFQYLTNLKVNFRILMHPVYLLQGSSVRSILPFLPRNKIGDILSTLTTSVIMRRTPSV